MSDRHMFRAWCPKCKRFVPMWSEAHFVDGELVVWCQAHTKIQKCGIQQCTGLKDCNDKLIYEGDILKSEYCDKPCIVHYGVGTFDSMHYKYVGFFLVRVGDSPVYNQVEDTDFGDPERHDWYEIIGNVHEHPELVDGYES